MADEVEEQEELDEELVFEKKPRKVLLYSAIVVVQLIVAGFLIWIFVMPEYNELSELDKAVSEQTDEEEIDEDEDEDEGEPKELGLMYKIENLTVNPKGTRGMRYAVFEFSLEVPSEDEIEILGKYNTVLVDNYIAYFRKKTMKELANDELLDSLKMDLSNIANNVLGSKQVYNVYFTRFVLE